MADYDTVDEATLQQMLSDATSYEERAALRQALRKKKKERGEAIGRTKPRGNSVYNRFAGSTAKTAGKSGGASKSGGTGSVPASNKSKQVVDSPTPKKAPESPVPSPVQEPVPSPVQEPVPSPVQEPVPTSPDLPAASEESNQDDASAMPADADEEVEHVEQDSPTPEETPVEDIEPEIAEVLDLSTKKEVSLHEYDHSAHEVAHDSTDSSTVGDLHAYLVAYVNQSLFLDPPLPYKGKALYDTCSDPTPLCKLINKSVPGTVDMRALSKVAGSTAQRSAAIEENMTLVIESARAIGCQITDSTQDQILHKEPDTIDKFLVDLIRARVVHMPGMEDEPASTFSNLQSLFEKLHVSVDDEQENKPVSWRDESSKVQQALQSSSPPSKSGSWREGQSDDLTYEERAALRKAEREQRLKEKEAGEGSVELSYEERAAQRKADRERRRREREALAK